MGAVPQPNDVPGFVVPVRRSLAEPILLGGAPRQIAILNGTLAAALGLGLRLWLVGIAFWIIGHALAVWAARRDPPRVTRLSRKALLTLTTLAALGLGGALIYALQGRERGGRGSGALFDRSPTARRGREQPAC